MKGITTCSLLASHKEHCFITWLYSTCSRTPCVDAAEGIAKDKSHEHERTTHTKKWEPMYNKLINVAQVFFFFLNLSKEIYVQGVSLNSS